MLETLVDSLEKPPTRHDRVIAIRGEQPVFLAGLDLEDRVTGGTPVGNSPVENVLVAFDDSNLLTVAVVDGAAIAGGYELALSCDITLESERATISIPLARPSSAPR